jgi:formylglycine-generating enzyme required for sulfatase activity
VTPLLPKHAWTSCAVLLALLGSACGKKSKTAPRDARTYGSSDAASDAGALDIEPTTSAPRPTPAKGKADCKLEYAPRPTRDPNPMCKVTGGEFMMGAPDDDKTAEPDERPAHRVRVRSFLMDQYEVTVEQVVFYLNTVQDNHCPSTQLQYSVDGRVIKPDVLCFYLGGDPSIIEFHDGKYVATPGTERHPVTRATFLGARRYCEWVGKRLPTEAEWEYAARHDPATKTDRRYPWGDTFEPNRANCSTPCAKCTSAGWAKRDCGDKFEREAPVGTFDGTNGTLDGSSPFGLHDMVGNAAEITATCYAPYQPCATVCEPAAPDATSECGRVLRPTGARSSREGATATSRSELGAVGGFRCAAALAP